MAAEPVRPKLEIGDRLAEIGLFDEKNEGVIFRLGRYPGRPIILFLSRDLRTPQAKRHLATLQTIAAEVERLDGCLCAVSPRTPAEHLPVSKEMKLTFPLLSDQSNQVLQALGLPDGGAPMTALLDSSHRLIARIGPAEIADHAGEALARLKAYDAVEELEVIEAQAPVLLLPRVLPPDLCAALVARWSREPHRKNMVSDYFSQVGVPSEDKIREDFFLPEDDPDTVRVLDLLSRRLFPEVRRVFNFEITRIEKIRIGGYDAQAGGMFKRHKDNTHRRTAHRRFAMSMNLNAGEFEGGEVIFPEFGKKLYRPPTGAALVFSCGLLHEARLVTKGWRMGMFTFFFGEEEEKYRQALRGETERRAKTV